MKYKFSDATIGILSNSINNLLEPTEFKLKLGECIDPKFVNFESFKDLLIMAMNRVTLDIKDVNIKGMIEGDQ